MQETLGAKTEYSRLAVETLRDATSSMTTPADFAGDFVLAYIRRVDGDFEAVDLVAGVAQEGAHRNPALYRGVAQLATPLAFSSS